ncbi:hypothetical protein VPH35_075828 [Triticum aestivum]
MGWGIVDCRDGYILLWNWNMMSVAAVNPMTWAVDIIPLPEDAREGRLRGFAWLGSRLLSCEENPWSFRVVCVCADVSRVRAAVFSSETWGWVIHPGVEIGGDNSLKYNAGMLVHGSVYRPFHGKHRMIRINTATTMDIFLSEEIGRVTRGWLGHLRVVQLRSGYVYLSMKWITPVGILRCWFLSLSLETIKIESLIHGTFGDCAYPYVMAWPPCLIGRDGSSTGHEVEGSH